MQGAIRRIHLPKLILFGKRHINTGMEQKINNHNRDPHHPMIKVGSSICYLMNHWSPKLKRGNGNCDLMNVFGFLSLPGLNC